MIKTELQYDEIIKECKEIFLNKNKDYGNSWKEFRPSSLTDQIYIKASRIKNIELKSINLIGDSIDSELKSIINYCLIAQLQIKNINRIEDLVGNELLKEFEIAINETRSLMILKNSDYGEIWRDMRPSTFTDMILVKLLRIKQIEDNQGNTISSEGVVSNYQDILNYAIFALIRSNT